MRFFQNSIINLVGQWLLIIVLFSINILVARLAGPSGKGIYTLLLLAGSVLTLISNLGFSRAAIYFVGQNPDSLERIVNAVWSLYWIVGSVMALTASIFLYGLDLSGDRLTSVELIAISLTCPFFLGNLAVGNIFAAVGKYVWLNTIPMISALIQVGLLPLCFALGFDRSSFVLTIVISTVASSVIGWTIINRNVCVTKFELDFVLIKKMLHYGLRSISYTIANFLNLRLDQLILGFLLNLSQVGIYSVAVAISEIAAKGSKAIAIVLFPEISAIDSASANQLTSALCRFFLSITILFSIGMILIGRFLIVSIFGIGFEGAYIPLVLLLPGVIAFNISQIVSTDLAGRGKPEIATYATLVGLFITVAGNILFVRRFGISGAAATASCAYITAACINVAAYLRLTDQRLVNIALLTHTDIKKIIDIVALLWSKLLLVTFTKKLANTEN